MKVILERESGIKFPRNDGYQPPAGENKSFEPLNMDWIISSGDLSDWAPRGGEILEEDGNLGKCPLARGDCCGEFMAENFKSVKVRLSSSLYHYIGEYGDNARHCGSERYFWDGYGICRLRQIGDESEIED